MDGRFGVPQPLPVAAYRRDSMIIHIHKSLVNIVILFPPLEGGGNEYIQPLLKPQRQLHAVGLEQRGIVQ